MKRSDIVAEARKWIGTPFLHQGRNAFGLDCVGLVQKVGDVWDIPYDDLFGYARAPTDPKFLRHLRKYLRAAPISGNKVGMVAVFRQSIYPCHVGIFGEDENGKITVINSRADMKKVIEETYTDTSFRLVEMLSFPGLED